MRIQGQVGNGGGGSPLTMGCVGQAPGVKDMVVASDGGDVGMDVSGVVEGSSDNAVGSGDRVGSGLMVGNVGSGVMSSCVGLSVGCAPGVFGTPEVGVGVMAGGGGGVVGVASGELG